MTVAANVFDGDDFSGAGAAFLSVPMSEVRRRATVANAKDGRIPPFPHCAVLSAPMSAQPHTHHSIHAAI
jgi:hypothetical protein